MTRQEEPASLGGDSRRGWQVVEISAWAAVGIQALQWIMSVVTSAGGMRIAALATGAGMVVLRGIILVGVRERARWSLWAGGALALLFFLSPLVLIHTHVETPAGIVEVPPTQAILGWAIVAVSAGYVLGAVMVLISDRKPR